LQSETSQLVGTLLYLVDPSTVEGVEPDGAQDGQVRFDRHDTRPAAAQRPHLLPEVGMAQQPRGGVQAQDAVPGAVDIGLEMTIRSRERPASRSALVGEWTPPST
jgi:hypothetical protein